MSKTVKEEGFHLVFGALADQIKKQMDKQKHYAIDPLDYPVWQKDADAISRLAVRGIISGSECRRARNRLFARITKGKTP